MPNGSEETTPVQYGARRSQAAVQLHHAEAEIRVILDTLAPDCRRAIGRRQIGAADWQLQRIEARARDALDAIGRAADALTVEEIRPRQGQEPF